VAVAASAVEEDDLLRLTFLATQRQLIPDRLAARLNEFACFWIDAPRRLAQLRPWFRVEHGADVGLARVQARRVRQQIGEQPRVAAVPQTVVQQRVAVL